MEVTVRKIVQTAMKPMLRVTKAGMPRSGRSSHHHDKTSTPQSLRTMKATDSPNQAAMMRATITGVLLFCITVNFYGVDVIVFVIVQL